MKVLGFLVPFLFLMGLIAFFAGLDIFEDWIAGPKPEPKEPTEGVQCADECYWTPAPTGLYDTEVWCVPLNETNLPPRVCEPWPFVKYTSHGVPRKIRP